MVNNAWARAPRRWYDIHLVPIEHLGAALAHVITVYDGHIAALQQITDTRCWELPPQS
jgi:hypothetical protein